MSDVQVTEYGVTCRRCGGPLTGDEAEFCELGRDQSPGSADTDLDRQVNVGSDGNL